MSYKSHIHTYYFIYPSLVLVQPRKTRPSLTERLLMGRKELNQTNKQKYLLLGEEQPQCVGCDAPFTIRYFLLECDDCSQIIHKYYQVHNMKQLFQDISVDNSMMFLKKIKLFNKI